MASLHRDRRKSPFWYVSYRTPDGKQHFRSTGEVDRTKGEAFAAAIEESLGRAKVGAFTETAAWSILADLYEEVSGRKLQFTSIEAWFASRLVEIKKRRRETTHRRYAAVIGDFLEFIGPVRAKAPVESIASDEIQRFADARLAEGRAIKTVQNDLKPIGKFLKDTERKGLLLKSPMGAVEIDEAEGETRDPFSAAELSSLLTYLSATKDAEGKPLSAAERASRRDWKTAVNLGAYVGARLGDALTVEHLVTDFLLDWESDSGPAFSHVRVQCHSRCFHRHKLFPYPSNTVPVGRTIVERVHFRAWHHGTGMRWKYPSGAIHLPQYNRTLPNCFGTFYVWGVGARALRISSRRSAMRFSTPRAVGR